MANTTFSGPIRSESTIKTISKDATSGTITEVTTLGGAPVSLSDGNVTLTNATHSGRVLLVPDGGQDNTYTLPAPIAGSIWRAACGASWWRRPRGMPEPRYAASAVAAPPHLRCRRPRPAFQTRRRGRRWT